MAGHDEFHVGRYQLGALPKRLTSSLSQTGFGVGIAGEYSNGINDCGVNLMYAGHIPVESDCAFWNNWQSWDQATKDGLLNFALASMDALVNPFFWTWKVGKPHVAFDCHRI